ncbi:MAG: hypothetical protein M1825_000535 [Sarcosagium campestre]|nr:MAG: hypothetical protein M1825_000535 [Sarcosagium campestre]
MEVISGEVFCARSLFRLAVFNITATGASYAAFKCLGLDMAVNSEEPRDPSLWLFRYQTDDSLKFSFEDVVLKGLAKDGGLFLPEDIPALPASWESDWKELSFEELAFNIFSLYISPDEIPSRHLKDIIKRSYSTFRNPDVTPLVELDPERKLYLLELFHGPTFAFKDVALQFLGNLFEYFLVRRNHGKVGEERHHLTVIGATSGDTGSAAIYGLRGKKDVSVFILYPKGRVSPIQEAQMTTVLDANVHNLNIEGSFDDCQDIVKALFADPNMNATHNLAAVNSINWARILAQITYYFHAYFSLRRSPGHLSGPRPRLVVPSGNFGNVLAGWFSRQMGLPIEKFVIATNENDILDRFFKSGGHYTKDPVHGKDAEGGIAEDGAKAHPAGVKETLSPAMDILISSNFERLIWYLTYRVDKTGPVDARREAAGQLIQKWLSDLKTSGTFAVTKEVFAAAQEEFESERVSDGETLEVIRTFYSTCDSPKSISAHATSHNVGAYILDPHTAVGIAAAGRSISRNPQVDHISLATAHPAKFSHAVDLALKGEKSYSFEKVLPAEFIGLKDMESRVTSVPGGAGWEGVREIIKAEVEQELRGERQ